MSSPTCTPARTVVPLAERERRPDRFVELLECLADLIVETGHQREAIARLPDGGDPRVPETAARIAALEDGLRSVSIEAATVHQLLQHLHLI
jgi:hypothetical protein